MLYVTYTVDWEIFAVKKFSPVAWAAKIERTKIKYRICASLRNRQAAKIKRAKINNMNYFYRENFPIYGMSGFHTKGGGAPGFSPPPLLEI